jgi:tetratricopeptide (TPR) repeat protein
VRTLARTAPSLRLGLAHASDAAAPAVPPPVRPVDGGWERELRRVQAAVAVGYPRGPAVTLPPFRSAAAARAWLDVRLPVLVAVPDPEFALRLAAAVGDHLDDADAVPLLRPALRAGGGAPVRLRLGLALRRLGHDAEAAEHLRAALPGLDAPADRAGALLELAGCRERQGRRLEAHAWYAEAYGACLHAGDPLGRTVALRRLRSPALVRTAAPPSPVDSRW